MAINKPLRVRKSPGRTMGTYPMKRSLNKGRRRSRYRSANSSLWRELERFHAMRLRLAGFLHQFKTLFHVIQSQAELLLDEPALSAQTRQSLELICQNAERLASQTKTMLDAAKG